MLEPAGGAQPYPRGFLRIAGSSLSQHQLGLAIALECQHVICITRGSSAELAALKHSAEAAGLRFHAIDMPQQLSALVTANDELVVVTEGLFAELGSAKSLLDGGSSVVLSLPDDGAVAEGFERLDINNAAAGLIRIPGSLVERLHDLPTDCDAPSALTRIALQAGAQMRRVPPELRMNGTWRMVQDEHDALAIERNWLRRGLGQAQAPTFSDRLAHRGVLAFGSSLLHGGNASRILGAGAVALLLLGLGSVWLGSASIAFGLVAAAWVVVSATAMLRHAERQVLNVAVPAIPRASVLAGLVDVCLFAISLLAGDAPGGGVPSAVEDRVFAPLMLLLMVHLARTALTGRAAVLACDRGVLALVLGAATGLGYLPLTIRLLAAALALACIVLPPRRAS